MEKVTTIISWNCIMRILLMVVLCCVSFNAVSATEMSKKRKNGASSIILRQSQGSITFVVDEDLPAPKKHVPTYDAKGITYFIMDKAGVGEHAKSVVKTSFENERMGYMGVDNVFQCIVGAYADHHPLELSPDVVWLLIGQGFARYVNMNAEELRDQLVFHEGKMDLVVDSGIDVLSPEADWGKLMQEFSNLIAENTKGEVVEMMTANFTTTGVTERVASQITLMKVVEEYFNYLNMAQGCGFPFITLKGTPEDWQKVLDKTRGLSKYGLESWVKELEPILKEFVKASEGNPNQSFWQGIVKKRRVGKLTTEKACGSTLDGTTKLDGWFLKFFLTEWGRTPNEVFWDARMPSEMVRVDFIHQYYHPDTRELMARVPMELWTGFVGFKEDPETSAIIPQIGWFARVVDKEKEQFARLQDMNKSGMGITINFYQEEEKVPALLSKMPHIRSLTLAFYGVPVNIPEWLENNEIDKFIIEGTLSDEEEAQLTQRFPKAKIRRMEPPKNGIDIRMFEGLHLAGYSSLNAKDFQ